MRPLHLITAEQEGTGSMLRMSLINVAVKSGPPSPCPFCCSVLVPLRRSQSHEQIVTLMMDMQPPSPCSYKPLCWSRVTALPPIPLTSPPREQRGVDWFTPIRERETALHTDFISADKFGGMRLCLEDFRNRRGKRLLGESDVFIVVYFRPKLYRQTCLSHS